MPSLLAIIATCVTTAATAAPADHPDNRFGDREAPAWWSTSSAADAPAPAAGIADFAPDPPGTVRSAAAPAVSQQDSGRPPFRLMSAGEATVVPKKSESLATPPPDARSNVLRPSPAASAAVAATTPAGMPVTAPAATPLAKPVASAPSLALGGHADKAAPGTTSPLTAMFTLGGSLSIVLGLFLVIAWAMRKAAPRGALVLPKEVFEILGRAPLGARQQVQLLRCGSKLLLVSITPQGAETLTEVTDPLEVDRIAGICQQRNPKSSTTAFRQVFQQLAAAPDSAAKDEGLNAGRVRSKRYRWEKEHA